MTSYVCVCVCSVTQLCSTLCDPMDCSPPGSSVHGKSPGKNTGVSCHALLQGIFPTQGSNLGLLHCRQILYWLSHRGSPRILEWVAYAFSRWSSRPRNQAMISCIADGFFTSWATRKLLIGPQFLHIESEVVSIVWQSLFKLWTFTVNVVLRNSSGKVFYKFKTKSRKITTSIFNKSQSNTHVSLLINTYFLAKCFFKD